MTAGQRFQQLTPELWITQSRWLYYNSGLFLSAGEACLIDPGMEPGEMDEQAQFVAAHGAQPATILLTHWHWDHVLGPEHFPGARVVAHSAYTAEVERNGGGLVREISRWEREAGLTRTAAFTAPVPDLLVGDGEALAVGGHVLRLMNVPGHSRDQLALYHPERGALWASDLLSDLEVPFISDSLAAYEQTLSGLAELELQVLAPGHGAAATDPREIQRRIERDLAYLRELRGNVSRAVEQGLSVAEAVAACAGMEYLSRSENEMYHRLNVESVYIELGGPADPSKVGWDQDDG